MPDGGGRQRRCSCSTLVVAQRQLRDEGCSSHGCSCRKTRSGDEKPWRPIFNPGSCSELVLERSASAKASRLRQFVADSEHVAFGAERNWQLRRPRPGEIQIGVENGLLLVHHRRSARRQVGQEGLGEASSNEAGGGQAASGRNQVNGSLLANLKNERHSKSAGCRIDANSSRPFT